MRQTGFETGLGKTAVNGRVWIGAAFALGLAACTHLSRHADSSAHAHTNTDVAALTPLMQSPAWAAPAPVLLFGEVHDNAQQHALRLQAFEALLARGARPALVMEQLDRDRQPQIEQLRAEAARTGSPLTAQHLLDTAAPGDTGWNWDFYRPFVQLALAHDLPLVAANVTREEGRRVMAQGLAATGFNGDVPDDITREQARLIVASHCGLVNEAQAARMVAVQVARDQLMARLVDQYRERGVVLLAGNGHVRRDVGVPRWLSPAAKTAALAVGFVEADMPEPGRFDLSITTPAAAREDPCAAMRAGPRG